MRHFFVILLCIVFMYSCDDDASQIGSGFFDDGSLDIVYVDSITAKVSTVQYDSIYTSDATRFLVGYHRDTDMGSLRASAFFQIAPTSGLVLDPETTVYTRTALHLKLDGYSQYDTGHHVTWNIYNLTQEMEQRDDGYLYNTSHFAFNKTPIGTHTFLPKPHLNDSLEITMNDAFGKKIFTLAQQEADEVSTQAEFIEAFKGLVISADSSSSGAVLGVNITPEIRIYYLDKTTVPSEEKSIVIKGGQFLKFNQILANRKDTHLKDLGTVSDVLPSESTENVAYLQGGTGLFVRIEFPYLREMLIQNPTLTITGASLECYPADELNERNTQLPLRLLTAFVDYRNNAISQTTLTPFLVNDDYLGRDTYYSLDVKSFVTSQMAMEESNHHALLFSLEASQSRHSVDLVRVGDQHRVEKMKLKVYCAVIKN